MLERYASLLREANARVNLVSRKDVQYLEERHILYCLSVAESGLLRSLQTLTDVGTGGGLPGIPIAIAEPQLKVTLVESVAKKVAAVEHIVQALGLSHVRVVRARAEQWQGSYDCVTGRAVCPLPEFIKMTGHLVAPRGIVVYLTGSRNPSERRVRGWQVRELAVRDIFPRSEWLAEKFILVAQRS